MNEEYIKQITNKYTVILDADGNEIVRYEGHIPITSANYTGELPVRFQCVVETQSVVCEGIIEK